MRKGRPGKPHNDGVMTFTEIAKELGSNEHAVWQVYCCAIRKLRNKHREKLEEIRQLAESKGNFKHNRRSSR